jgi:hypothetical protein
VPAPASAERTAGSTGRIGRSGIAAAEISTPTSLPHRCGVKSRAKGCCPAAGLLDWPQR